MLDLRNMRDASDLAKYLGISEGRARQLLVASPEEVFKTYEIPKRGNRGVREIWEVTETWAADMYKGLARRLNALFVGALAGFPHPSAHGYVAGRSTWTNALAHLGQRRVLCTDIRAFFKSIQHERVRQLLLRCGLNNEAAAALSRILSWDDHVPLGLHTSPIVANAVCHDLDARLRALAPAGRYTRYADDLFFSGPELPTRNDVAAALAADGFEIAPRKWSLAKAGRGLYVTGLSLEHGDRPRAPRSMKRRLRQDLHHADRYGLRQHLGRRGYPSFQSGINKIHGTIQYLRGIERDLGDRLNKEWMELLGREGVAVAYPTQERLAGRTVLFLLDESVPPDRDVLLLCLTVVEDVEWVSAEVQRFLDDRIADTMTAESERAVLKQRGLHWNELTPDNRTRATELLRTLPFRSFVAYAALPKQDKASYAETYARTLAQLLRDRMIRYDGCTLKIVGEENPRVGRRLLSEIANSIFSELECLGARRPAAVPSCEVLSKGSNPALPLPDLVLGVLGDFALSIVRSEREEVGGGKKKRRSGDQASIRFEQISHKVKAIYDLQSGVVYSRRNPFTAWPLDNASTGGE